MFEGVIANLLNKILGDFIEGIESKQLNISILKGDVELFNLSIKPDFLETLPLPFKLKYGKVGRIFVDVPVTGLLSKPLKLQVSEIFIMVEPKKVEEFNEEVIRKAFIDATQSSLNKLEDYLNSQIEATSSDSGVVTRIVNRLIDNIQIDIENIYVRFEDSITNTKMHYAVGLSLEAIQLYTCNSKFEREFNSGKSRAYKTAKITNLNIYLDYAEVKNRKRHKITFDELATIHKLKDIEDDDIRNIIIERNEKGREPTAELIRTKNFMLEEIKGVRDNKYLVEKFCIEIRIIYNKNPKKNKAPMLCASLVIGGRFKEDAINLLKDSEGTSTISLSKSQMVSILKFLDFSQSYTKFQAGVQKEFIDKKFKGNEKVEYMNLYEEYKNSEKKDKAGKPSKHTLDLKEELSKSLFI